MYDTQKNIFGFTFNSVFKPLSPVIRIKKQNEDEWVEYPFLSTEASTVDDNVENVSYYISKTEIPLEKNTAYSYFICDKGLDINTDETVLCTRDSGKKIFSFAHVGDSQSGPNEFRNVLACTYKEMGFLIHTGDVVQYTKYESQWTEMLDTAYHYLSSVPVMAIARNHEATCGKNAGKYEIEKHFNNQLLVAQSTELGCFYSFMYGDVKFIMLNTNDLENNRLKEKQYNWLVKELKENKCRWTVVSMHNPIYSVGKYGVNPNMNGIAVALREQLQGVFAEYGVDVVLQGHDHAISRTAPIDGMGRPQEEAYEIIDGIEYSVDPKRVIYLMNGPAGTQVREPVEIDTSLYKYAEKSNPASWSEISFDGNLMLVEVKWYSDSTQHTYHKWGIRKYE